MTLSTNLSVATGLKGQIRGMIADYARDYTVVNGVQNFLQFFPLLISETTYFNLLRSAKLRHFI